jgi:hypothetical protein
VAEKLLLSSKEFFKMVRIGLGLYIIIPTLIGNCGPATEA